MAGHRNRRISFWLASVVALAATLTVSNPVLAQNASPGVNVYGHLTQEFAETSGTIRFWISIENRTNTLINDIHIVEVYAPGFVLQGRCATQMGAPGMATAASSCCLTPTPSAGAASCAGIAPGGSLSASFDLLANKPDSEYDFYATVAWTSVSATGSPTPFSTNVPLGKGRAVNWINHLLFVVPSQPLIAVVPIIGVLLAALFAWETKRLEQRAMTWTSTMLVESHKAALQYYMPMATWFRAAAVLLEAYRKSLDPAHTSQSPHSPLVPPKAYFCMMVGQWFYWQTLINETAFHLKNLTGEDVVQQLYGRHNELFGLTDQQFKCLTDRILRKLKRKTSLDDFLVLMDVPQDDVHNGWKHFCQWARTPACDQDVEVLGCFTSVLEYEINRPNMSWYGSLDPLRLHQKHVDLILSLRKDDDSWRATVDEYLAWARVVTRQGILSVFQICRFWAGKPSRVHKRWEDRLNAAKRRQMKDGTESGRNSRTT